MFVSVGKITVGNFYDYLFQAIPMFLSDKHIHYSVQLEKINLIIIH